MSDRGLAWLACPGMVVARIKGHPVLATACFASSRQRHSQQHCTRRSSQVSPSPREERNMLRFLCVLAAVLALASGQYNVQSTTTQSSRERVALRRQGDHGPIRDAHCCNFEMELSDWPTPPSLSPGRAMVRRPISGRLSIGRIVGGETADIRDFPYQVLYCTRRVACTLGCLPPGRRITKPPGWMGGVGPRAVTLTFPERVAAELQELR